MQMGKRVSAAGWHRHLVESLLAVAIVASFGAVPAMAKLCPNCIHHVGLDTFYIHNSNDGSGPPCGGNVSDPINVVWTSYASFSAHNKLAPTVAKDLGNFSNGAWGQTSITDAKGVRNKYFQCMNESLDVATGAPIAPSRNHSRVFDTYTNDAFFAVGDAHHDYEPPPVGLPFPKIYYCHGATDYVGPKRDIAKYFVPPQSAFKPHYQFWGNTQPIHQGCTGESPRSNGYTAVLFAPGP